MTKLCLKQIANITYHYGHHISFTHPFSITINRYNPEHLKKFEDYVDEQARKNTYDLEANLAVLKLYQFNPHYLNEDVSCTILFKALTNFPHNDFTLCKCLLMPRQMGNETVKEIIYLADMLEQCDFDTFWMRIQLMTDKFTHIVGFYDSIRKFICHVVGITFQTIERDYLIKLLGDISGTLCVIKKLFLVQFFRTNYESIYIIDGTLAIWIKKYGWKDQGDLIFISSQDENIKTKNITEKIEFENLAGLMAACL